MRSPSSKRHSDFRIEALEQRRVMTGVDAVLPPGEPVTQADTWSADAWPSDVDWIQQRYGLTGAGQTVAVIDSGVAYDHYALGGGFGTSYRVVGGWDFAENDADPYDDAPAGFHGTHVAGIIGSDDETYGGVAPEVDLVALRVFNDQGESSFDWVHEALAWVNHHQYSFENPITTVNLSLGTAAEDVGAIDISHLNQQFAQLEANGIFVAVSAGNQFEGTVELTYPASSPHVVPVASVGSGGDLSAFSQRSARVLAAPGEMITSTVPDFLFGFDGTTDDWLSVSGTSAAAPHVAGASVLLRDAFEFAGDPQVTQSEIYQHLRNTADTVYDPATNASYRRVNLSRALEQALPQDDHGNHAALATDLGHVAREQSVSGTINELGDVDYFSLTPTVSGTLTVTVASPELDSMQMTGEGVVSSTGTLSFDVRGGEQVEFGISSQVGIGHYSTLATLVPDHVASVPAAPNTSLSESHLRWIPSAAGVYLVDLTFAAPDQVSVVTVYDGSHTAVFSTDNPARTEQFAVSVDQIQAYEIVIRGHDTAASFAARSMGAVAPQDSQDNDAIPTWVDVAQSNADQAIQRLGDNATQAAIRAFANSGLPRGYVEEAMDSLFASMLEETLETKGMANPSRDGARRASVDLVLPPYAQHDRPDADSDDEVPNPAWADFELTAEAIEFSASDVRAMRRG